MGNLAAPLSSARTVTPTASTRPIGRILVVEDDPAVQKALRRLFETEGGIPSDPVRWQVGLDSSVFCSRRCHCCWTSASKVSGRDVCKEIKAMAPDGADRRAQRSQRCFR
jgi:hypothetical protein